MTQRYLNTEDDYKSLPKQCQVKVYKFSQSSDN